MAYFRELPNLQVLNRTKNLVSNDETVIVKNFFKRAKLREDIGSVVSAFEYYLVIDNERPDQIAEKIYGDPELDWVILMCNNITNVQDQWPLNLDSFNKYLLDKYGSEDAFDDVHHYETLSYNDSFGREIFVGGLIVDEAFYNSPKYVGIGTTVPPGITFPPIYIPGITPTLSPIIGAGYTIASVNIINPGLGYSLVPTVNVSPPAITLNASAICTTSNFNVTGITTFNGGRGYNTVPDITFSPPIQSVQSTATCELGTGLNIDKVTTITNLVGGIGYGLTAPSVTFSYSPRIVFGVYNNQSLITVGNDVEGFYFRSDGTRLYSASFTGSNQIRQYNLSEGWNISTISLDFQLDVSADFAYTTGVEFKPDGTLMYVTGGIGFDYKIVTYQLSTAWSISSASKINQITIASPGGIRLKSDGTSVFILDFSTPDTIKEFTLSTPWNLLTRSGSAVRTFNIASPTGDNNILGFSFNDEGTKLFVASEGSSSIYEFNLDTWDISTAVLTYTFFVGDRLISPADIFVQPNRDKFVVAGGSSDRVFEYNNTSNAKGITGITNGKVTSITITQPGSAYTVAPSVTISSPYPAVTAQATAILGLQKAVTTRSYGVSNNGTGSYFFTGDAIGNNPTLTVNAGDTLSFNLVSVVDHPFWIKKINSTGTLNSVTTGTITGTNGAQSGILSWNTNGVTPGTYYYNCQFHAAMNGIINVLENPVGVVTSITITNPGFGYTVTPTVGIQSAPEYRQAVIGASISQTTTGISSFKIFDGGLNYVTTPTITLTPPNELLNVGINSTYSQDSRTWRWTGSEWQEKVTEEFQYFDPILASVIKIPGSALSRPITNYEYENTLNENKRKLFIIKPAYISVIITDLRNMMSYNEDGPNYITDKLKKTYNEKIMGI